MKIPSSSSFRASLLLCSCLMFPMISSAATVTNITSAGVDQPRASTGTSIDVSALGSVNWAVWDVRTTASTTSPVAPYATKTGGTGTISGIGFAGSSTNVRGTNTTTSFVNTFTWTGGTAVPNADGKLTGIFGGNVNTLNNGASFSLTDLAPLDAGQSYQISVLAAVFNGQGTMTATTGASSPFQLGISAGATNERLTQLFQFNYTPELATDSLSLSWILTSVGTGGSAHATIQAVAISIIPEASTASLAILGTATALLRRKRRF